MKLLLKIDLLRLGRGGIAALGLLALAFPLALWTNTYAITSCMSLCSFYWTWFVMRTDKESGFERWLLTLPGVTRRSLAYSRYLPAVLFAAALGLFYTAAAAVFAPEEFLPISRSAVMGAALSAIYVSVAVPILNWRRAGKGTACFCSRSAAREPQPFPWPRACVRRSGRRIISTAPDWPRSALRPWCPV